jgi:uncharacterized membrane protein
MSALSIWMFRTAGGAEVALRILDDLRADQLITVDDAAAVSWPDDRRTPRTWQDCCLTGPNALAGAFWDCSSESCSCSRSPARQSGRPPDSPQAP